MTSFWMYYNRQIGQRLSLGIGEIKKLIDFSDLDV